MTARLEHVRIFAASPGDVGAERESLSRVVAELNQTIAPHRNLSLELVRWETHCHPGMGRAQGLVNAQVGAYDVFVGIMWRRFGSPTGRAESGTEEEFRLAYDTWTGTDRPWIMFYFCEAPFYPKTKAETDQMAKVLAFKDELQQKGLVWHYPCVFGIGSGSMPLT
jgi:hypothetical protein